MGTTYTLGDIVVYYPYRVRFIGKIIHQRHNCEYVDIKNNDGKTFVFVLSSKIERLAEHKELLEYYGNEIDDWLS